MKAVAALALLSPVLLANTLVSPGPHGAIAGSKLSASPITEWNKLRRNDGSHTEVWTIDGDQLNKVTFYAAIGSGRPLMREVHKRQTPLPHVSTTMLITDIPALLESTYRSQFAVDHMQIGAQEPALVAGHKGIHFAYSLTRADDEVERKGEGYGAMIGGELYMVTYEAPALYFFDKDVAKFRALAASLAL
jgi:hypothetical protein